MSLENKTAIVTGGARGIGAAVCRKLASLGADIAIVDLNVTDQAKELEAELTGMGVRAKAYACNVADNAACKALVKQVVADFGCVTILVNNAGITRDALFLSMKEEDFDAVINTNLKGTFNMTQACYRPFFKQKYGKIVNLASVSALLGTAGQANYAASKSGIIALTKVTARELAPKQVTCNAVAPGFIATDMTKGLEDQYVSSIPLGRAGKPEDVANLIAFLVSPESDYLTGTVIRIDGGLAIS
ncbi:MAG TPA: 3-oxoacyl-[acyl-carrier-protein] reductase [Ruminococcus sp.]|nr:3-oxoacyl-[acyl-carrier-protein] reductase [Ruminococcus sp.]